jgi:hypothetical protein
MDLREQMEPEEKARFDHQIEAEQQMLLAVGRTHPELQALPIGNPNPVPKPQFRKKKTHGVADAPRFEWGGDCWPRLESAVRH